VYTASFDFIPSCGKVGWAFKLAIAQRTTAMQNTFFIVSGKASKLDIEVIERYSILNTYESPYLNLLSVA
jgi:hypothetical protein